MWIPNLSPLPFPVIYNILDINLYLFYPCLLLFPDLISDIKAVSPFPCPPPPILILITSNQALPLPWPSHPDVKIAALLLLHPITPSLPGINPSLLYPPPLPPSHLDSRDVKIAGLPLSIPYPLSSLVLILLCSILHPSLPRISPPDVKIAGLPPSGPTPLSPWY